MKSPSITRHPITDEATWLSWRTQDVTSTEISCLYGLNPYRTEFELWHNKKSGRVEAIEPSERMRWGNRLQDAIADGAAQDRGWTARRLNEYARWPEARIGSSFDSEVVAPDRGKGLLEIKNVDRSIFLRDWQEDGEVVIAPPHIEMQMQYELLVGGYGWGAIVALVGGNELKVGIREADARVHEQMVSRVDAFWRSIEAGTPPSPTFPADAEFITKQLYGHAAAGTSIHASIQVEGLLATYHELGAQIKHLEELRDEAKARVLLEIGPVSKVLSSRGVLSCGETAPSPGTLITQEMVGTHISPRKGFRLFRFTQAKDKS